MYLNRFQIDYLFEKMRTYNKGAIKDVKGPCENIR